MFGTRRVGVAWIWGGGGTRPTPPSLASVVHTFEAAAGSWRSVSAPAASWVEPQSKKKSTKKTFGEGFL